MSKESRIEALKAAAEQKKRRAEENLDKAIRKLISEGQPLTFADVAREAGLSVSYLYKYPEIKERINELRNQQQQIRKPSAPQKASEDSKSTMIYQLRERIKKLEAEITGLRRVNEGLAGRVYHLQDSYDLAERLKTENKELKAKNEKLEQELARCHAQANLPESQPPVNAKVTPIDDKRKERTGITDEIKQELLNIGVQLNSTLTKAIRSSSEETVMNAIAAFKEASAAGYIEKPGAWLKRAVEEEWKPNDSPSGKTVNQLSNEFQQWFKLAKAEGIVKSKKEDGSEFMVEDITGKWSTWESYVERGWTLEYFKERAKRLK